MRLVNAYIAKVNDMSNAYKYWLLPALTERVNALRMVRDDAIINQSFFLGVVSFLAVASRLLPHNALTCPVGRSF